MKNGWNWVFCIFLLLTVLLVPLGQAELYEPQYSGQIAAQIVLRDAEGTEYGAIDLPLVVTSAGDTCYWFNMFNLDETKTALLQGGYSLIRAYNAETDEQLPDTQIPADAGIGILYDGETIHRSDI